MKFIQNIDIELCVRKTYIESEFLLRLHVYWYNGYMQMMTTINQITETFDVGMETF